MSDKADRVRIEYMPVDKLAEAPRNPKLHSVEEIKSSMRRFGFVAVPAINETTGRLVAGHGRKEALVEMQAAGEPPPARIRVKNKAWLVPVLRGVAFATDAEAEAYLLADNRLTEIGGYDEELLAKMIAELNGAADGLQGVGYDEKEIARLIETTHEPATGNCDPDDVPEPPVEPFSKRGDLWLLGDHRILCGDSTSAEDLARLMGGERAGLMNTDPPYGVAYANDDRPNPGVAKPRVAKPRVANDELCDEVLQEFLEAAFKPAVALALKKDAAWYLWHAHLTQGYFAAAAAAANVVLHRQIIWVKPVLLLGRGQYHWKHEPAFMGWVKGHQPPDYGEGNGERTQTTVWEIGSVTQAERKEFNHSSPKPVGLFEIPIIKHLRRGEICYEPFSGSGPQIIAAEMHGRRCFACELEPRYVDVAVARWEKFTGRKAIKADTVEKPKAPRKPRSKPENAAAPEAPEVGPEGLPF